MADDTKDGLSIKQKADLEAEAAEAETPDEETVEQPADEPGEDEQAEEDEQPAEPQSGGRRGKSPQEVFEAAFTAFRKKAAQVFEVPVGEIVSAPHPGVVGIMLPGFAEPKTHENYTGCQTCNTIGKVLTGANTGDPTNDWHVCPDNRCKGRGYWEKSSAVPAPPATGPLAVQPPATPNGEYADAPAWMGDPSLSAGV